MLLFFRLRDVTPIETILSKQKQNKFQRFDGQRKIKQRKEYILEGDSGASGLSAEAAQAFFSRHAHVRRHSRRFPILSKTHFFPPLRPSPLPTPFTPLLFPKGKKITWIFSNRNRDTCSLWSRWNFSGEFTFILYTGSCMYVQDCRAFPWWRFFPFQRNVYYSLPVVVQVAR